MPQTAQTAPTALSPPSSLPSPRAPFMHPVRVYWEDTDAGGVVFYANYLRFFERARTEWLRSLGFQQQALREATGAIFIVIDTRVSFRAPARLDDRLQVSVELRHAGRASMTIEQRAWREDSAPGPTSTSAAPRGGMGKVAEPHLLMTLIAEGDIRVGCVDAATFRPRRIPNPILEALS